MEGRLLLPLQGRLVDTRRLRDVPLAWDLIFAMPSVHRTQALSILELAGHNERVGLQIT